mgnify:CR=1 FL=1
MSEASAEGVSVTVRGAHKRDAGRGIARLPEAVRSRLGVLSGDPIVVTGDGATVVKVWPADEDGEYVQIDADTRANAGVTVGDSVTVRPGAVEDAEKVVLRPEAGFHDGDGDGASIRRRLADRLVGTDERVNVEGHGSVAVESTIPEGPVRITDDTDVALLEPSADVGSAPSPDRPHGETASETPAADRSPADVTYEDIGGLDQELDRVREMIELPLADPETFHRLGIDPPSGVLLHGPPGTGKTLIARAVANEVDAYFETISGPQIVSKFKGESEERLREAFDRAQERSPAILFVDEIDSIAGARDEDADMETRVVAQLLTLMDGLEERGRVIVIGATNRVDAIDEALRRGGRFDREIEIGVPDVNGRREILDVHTRGVPLADDVDLDRIAAATHGFVGADLQSLTTEAAMSALRRDASGPTVTRADFEAALAAVEPSAMREYVAESPAVDFDDVGGLDDVTHRLREIVEWPLTYGPLFDAARTDPPTGILLHGPPGTGKTLLARATAGESGVNFIHVNGPELLDRYVGESEKSVRELFERARQTAPTILFLDEIDAIASQRGSGNEVTERVVSQLLTELDRVREDPTVVVLAATNRPGAIDRALRRPGRLEEDVFVPVPDAAGRRAILAIHLRDRPTASDLDLDEIVARTEDFSGAEIAALVREASMGAIRSVAAEIDPATAAEHAEDVVLDMADFDAALARMDREPPPE